MFLSNRCVLTQTWNDLSFDTRTINDLGRRSPVASYHGGASIVSILLKYLDPLSSASDLMMLIASDFASF